MQPDAGQTAVNGSVGSVELLVWKQMSVCTPLGEEQTIKLRQRTANTKQMTRTVGVQQC